MSSASFNVTASSGISPIEAGYGLVHADTIVATTRDELRLTPPGILKVNGRETRGNLCNLGRSPGIHDASLDGRKLKLILAEPDRVVRRFGARHGSLEHDIPVITGEGATASWDTLRKTGSRPDLVVDFDAP